MPLTRIVLDWTSRLGALLADGAIAVVDVALPAENEEMASRIVVNWASQRGGTAAFVGIDLSSEAAFCRSVEVGLDSISRAVRQATADGPELGELGRAAGPRSAASIGRTLEELERVASWASPLVHGFVLAGRCSSGAPAWLRTAVTSTACSVRWLLLHDERTPLGLGDRVARRAAEPMAMRSLADARRQLAAHSVRGGASRVLTCEGPVEDLLPFIERECLVGLSGWRIVRAARTTVDARAVALSGIEALGALERAAGDPVRALGRALDAAADAQPTMIVLAASIPPGGRACVDLAERGARLAAHVLSPDARVLLVGRGVSREPAPARVVAHPFRIDAQCIEEGIARRLAGDCARPEACRFEAALASFAASRGEDETALAHAERAVRLALEEREAPSLLVGSLMTLGSVFSHAERLTEALEAFTRCAELASASGDHVVVGRALGSIGHLYLRVASLDFAIRCYRASSAVSRSVEDETGAAHAETWLAEALLQRGDAAEAARTLDGVVESVPRALLPALDALFAPARGEACARLAAILRDAGLRKRADEVDRAAAEAGHRGPLCSCPYP